MGTSTDAQLDYGYDLGDDPAGVWPDYAPDSETEFVAQLYNRLFEAIPADALASVQDEEPQWDWQREDAAQKYFGVEFQSYCSCEYSMWLLSAHQVMAYRGDAEVIDFAHLTKLAAEGDWDAKLRRVIDVLGLRLKQPKAEWLLTSMWC